MSASQASALTAIAFQLAAAVESYELDLDRLVAPHADPELHVRVGSHMDRMRMYAAALPALSAAWVEVLIRHFEITHGFWRLQKGEMSPDELCELHGNQRTATSRLRRQCLQLLAEPG